MAVATASAAYCFALGTTPYPKMTVMSTTAVGKEYQMRVPYELKQGQSRLFHKLPSGLNMEVIVQKGVKLKVPDEENQNPPLVFVHGSFHAAWCWAQHWLPFFQIMVLIAMHSAYWVSAVFFFPTGKGNTYLNIQSTSSDSISNGGESDTPAGSVAGSLKTLAGDVADFIRKETKLPPVLLGHSFGGLIVQYYIANIPSPEMESLHPDLCGAVLICSVPPSGNSGLVWRYLFSKPIAAFKVTRSLAAKAFQTSLPLCRETFFSAAMDDHLVLSYQKLMTESSRMPMFDLRKLNASLPVPSVRDPSLQILVLGANDDFIVDGKGVAETGMFYGVQPVCIEGVAHDIMLDISWEKGAKSILSWVKGLKREQTE